MDEFIYQLLKKRAESESADPDLDLRKPARLECVASSMSGVTIFSVMSVRTVKVGMTMKSMNPACREKDYPQKGLQCKCQNNRASL